MMTLLTELRLTFVKLRSTENSAENKSGRKTALINLSSASRQRPNPSVSRYIINDIQLEVGYIYLA